MSEPWVYTDKEAILKEDAREWDKGKVEAVSGAKWNVCRHSIPIDQKDFFVKIGYSTFKIFHLFSNKGKGTEETFWLVGKKGFTKPPSCAPTSGQRWVSGDHT